MFFCPLRMLDGIYKLRWKKYEYNDLRIHMTPGGAYIVSKEDNDLITRLDDDAYQMFSSVCFPILPQIFLIWAVEKENKKNFGKKKLFSEFKILWNYLMAMVIFTIFISCFCDEFTEFMLT